VPVIVNTKLAASLKKNDTNMIIEETLFKKHVSYDKPYNLANIQNFNTLVPISQKLSKPMFELKQEDNKWEGAIWSKLQNGKNVGVKHKIEESRIVYEKLAISVSKLIGLVI
jgi:hypothetical protein